MTFPKGPRPDGRERAAGTSVRVYRVLLRAYPRELRNGYGDQMARCFLDLCRSALKSGGGLGLAALWAGVLPELLFTAVKERSAMLARNAYRVAVAATLASVVFLLWGSLGMGIIGADGDPANVLYVGVLAVGIVGAVAARFRPEGMARALVAMAIAQAVVAAIALILGLGGAASPPLEIVWLNGFYGVLFVGAAWLFRHAARESIPADAR